MVGAQAARGGERGGGSGAVGRRRPRHSPRGQPPTLAPLELPQRGRHTHRPRRGGGRGTPPHHRPQPRRSAYPLPLRPNFGERPLAELRRTPFSRTSENSPSTSFGE